MQLRTISSALVVSLGAAWLSACAAGEVTQAESLETVMSVGGETPVSPIQATPRGEAETPIDAVLDEMAKLDHESVDRAHQPAGLPASDNSSLMVLDGQRLPLDEDVALAKQLNRARAVRYRLGEVARLAE